MSERELELPNNKHPVWIHDGRFYHVWREPTDELWSAEIGRGMLTVTTRVADLPRGHWTPAGEREVERETSHYVNPDVMRQRDAMWKQKGAVLELHCPDGYDEPQWRTAKDRRALLAQLAELRAENEQVKGERSLHWERATKLEAELKAALASAPEQCQTDAAVKKLFETAHESETVKQLKQQLAAAEAERDDLKGVYPSDSS